MGFFDQLAQCKPCSQSDPTQDTVKVDPTMLASDKENVPNFKLQELDDLFIKEKEAERLHKEQELREAEEIQRQAEAEAAEKKRRAEEEAMKKKEEEPARAAADASARKAAEKAEEEKRRLAREQFVAKQAEAEAARLAEEEHARQEALKEEERQRRAQAKVNAWCKANGYANVNSQKKKLFGGAKFPLHEAVAKKDLELMKALIDCGAAKSAKNSKGQTASDLANKNNKDGSMNEFLAALA